MSTKGGGAWYHIFDWKELRKKVGFFFDFDGDPDQKDTNPLIPKTTVVILIEYKFYQLNFCKGDSFFVGIFFNTRRLYICRFLTCFFVRSRLKKLMNHFMTPLWPIDPFRDMPRRPMGRLLRDVYLLALAGNIHTTQQYRWYLSSSPSIIQFWINTYYTAVLCSATKGLLRQKT